MLTGIPDNYIFYLASRSPRRQQLLREAGINFELIERDFEETYPLTLKGKEIAEYLARSKASCFPIDKMPDNQVVITADTIVWCDGQVLDKPLDEKAARNKLGLKNLNYLIPEWHASKSPVLDKPSDEKEAFRILSAISGNSHDVITGICLVTSKGYHTFSETTRVTFCRLSDEEISYYINRYRPYDKAGAYGIQEWIGVIGNNRIEGSYFNVMGLPVQRLISELRIILGN